MEESRNLYVLKDIIVQEEFACILSLGFLAAGGYTRSSWSREKEKREEKEKIYCFSRKE